MGRIKYLQSEFEGRASCKAFKYSKLLSSYGVFLYEVTSPEGMVHYDVFKTKIIKTYYDCDYDHYQPYPSDEVYGKTAWNYRSLRKALERFFSLFNEAEDNHLRQMAEAGIYSSERFENGFYDE